MNFLISSIVTSLFLLFYVACGFTNRGDSVNQNQIETSTNNDKFHGKAVSAIYAEKPITFVQQRACPDSLNSDKKTECLSDNRKSAEFNLNTIWPRAKRLFEATDARAAEMHSLREESEAAGDLATTAQALWLKTRELECRVWTFRNDGSPGESNSFSKCTILKTVTRTEDLKKQVDFASSTSSTAASCTYCKQNPTGEFDLQLDALVQKTRALLKSSSLKKFEMFNDAQLAWLEFSEAECKAIAYDPQSRQPDVSRASNCLSEKSQQRMTEIRSLSGSSFR